MKRWKLPVVFVVAVPVVAGLFWLVSSSRAATESPVYEVVRSDGEVEVRDYPALTVATTPMEGGGMNRGFGRLFKFITGSNEGAQKIEMTSPVLIDSSADKPTMSFIMPKKAVEQGVPQPASGEVTVGTVAAARFAVLRFKGGRTADNEKAALQQLQHWFEAQKLTAEGQPLFAYYDPPWTPLFLRRNEVMLRIEKSL